MKKRNNLFRSVAAIVAVGLLLTSGCWLIVVGTAAAGTVAYMDGKLEASLGNGYEAVATAANKAIVQLDFAKPEERKDSLSDTLISHTAKGDRVEVVVTKVGDTLTKVTIRIGTFGDQAMSRGILDKIKANL